MSPSRRGLNVSIPHCIRIPLMPNLHLLMMPCYMFTVTCLLSVFGPLSVCVPAGGGWHDCCVLWGVMWRGRSVCVGCWDGWSAYGCLGLAWWCLLRGAVCAAAVASTFVRGTDTLLQSWLWLVERLIILVFWPVLRTGYCREGPFLSGSVFWRLLSRPC